MKRCGFVRRRALQGQCPMLGSHIAVVDHPWFQQGGLPQARLLLINPVVLMFFV